MCNEHMVIGCIASAKMLRQDRLRNVAVAVAVAELGRLMDEQRRRDEEARRARAGRIWVRPWLLRRPQFGWYEHLMQELVREDPRGFARMMRMEPAMFHAIAERLRPIITKRNTAWREALHPELKLSIALRHFCSGDSYLSLSHGFRVADNTVCVVVIEVAKAIIEVYMEELVQCPSTPEGWREKAREWQLLWQVYFSISALDGKHCGLKKPPKSGSAFHNYKGFFSIILLAMVDARYRFMWMDVGANGMQSDAQVFNASELKERLENGTLGLPPPETLPGQEGEEPIHYHILGDDAFALQPYLMKPYSKRNMTREERLFNYRLSRGRRVVENAFGILANRFPVLLRTMPQLPDTAELIVQACVCLHNLMRTEYPTLQERNMDVEDDHHNIRQGVWRRGAQMVDGEPARHGFEGLAAKRQRDRLRDFVNGPGAVAWQDRMVD